jgi:septal ring factor EnvC (AmiA/AmiB activator)
MQILNYLRENRAKLIRAFIIAAGALLFALLIWCAAEYVASARSARKIAAAEAVEREASARAKSLEAEANELKAAKEALEIELRELESRAANAEDALRNARGKVVTLKEEYETIRYRDVPTDPVSVVDICGKLSGLGYSCE